jgi:ArsR family transcriptional regulator
METRAEASPSVERLFHALSDEKRLRVVEVLRGGECCVCDLAGVVGVGQSLLSFHLKTLKEAGVVTDRRDGRWVHYSLNPEALGKMRAFVRGLEKSARGATSRLCCRHAER